MKRPAGLIASTVVLALVSLLQVVVALSMVAAAEFSSKAGPSAARPGAATVPPPAWMPMFMYGFAGFFLALAIWGIVSAVGLHRLRNWARLSVLIIGGGMAFIGFFSTLAMLAVMFIPLPMSPGMGAAQAHTTQIMIKAVFAFIALFYAGILGVGVWWLVYFNRQSVRALFVNALGEVEESRRPLLVSLFAALLLIGAPFCAVMAFLPFPSLIFGLILHGWEKTLFYLLYAAVSAGAGIGLWRLQEWGRRLTLALMAVGVINCSIYAFFPSLGVRGSAEVNKALGIQQSPLPSHFQSMMFLVGIVPSILVFLAIGIMLHHYREKFSEPAEPTLPPPELAA